MIENYWALTYRFWGTLHCQIYDTREDAEYQRPYRASLPNTTKVNVIRITRRKKMDLTKLSTLRLLALFKKVRSCDDCHRGDLECPHNHPSIEQLRDECSRRKHVSREKRRRGS